MKSSRRNPPARARAASPIQNRKWLLCLLIPVLVVGVYGTFTKGPFLYDDLGHILQNQTVTSFKGLSDFDSVQAVFRTAYGLSARPLLNLTYGWNYHTFGPNPAAFRIVNILIHCVNAALLFLLTMRIAELAGRAKPEAFWIGLAAGCIFAVHPLLIESVTYIAGRSASLCAMFYLLGLWAAVEAGSGKQLRWTRVAAVLICFIVAMLVKQDAAMLPLAAIAFVWLAWPETRTFRQRLAVSLVLLLAQTVVFLVFQSSIRAVADFAQQNPGLVAGGSEPTLAFVPYLLTSVKEWVFYYSWRLFLPVHLSVDPESRPIFSPTIPVILAAAVIIGLVVLGYYLAKRDRLVGASFVLILMSPLAAYCVFPLADVVAEHRAYLAVAGSAMLLAVLCSKLHKRQIILVGLLAVYAGLALARNSVWMDAITLWEDASRKAPDKLRPHMNLGLEYEGRGRNDLAISHYKLILTKNSDYFAARTNLAALYVAQDELQNAQDLLLPVVRKNVQFAPVYVNLAIVRIRQRDFEGALALLDRAKEINPRQVQVAYTRGIAYSNMDRPDLAIQEYLRELDLDPGSVAAELELGHSYETIGERDKAISYYQKVVAAQPSNAEALQGLARIVASRLSK